MIPGPTPSDSQGTTVVEVEIFRFPAKAAAVSAWDVDSRCALHVEPDGTIHLVANVAGLRSLARHALTLAQEGQAGAHLDYDADSGWFDTSEFGLRLSRGWD